LLPFWGATVTSPFSTADYQEVYMKKKSFKLKMNKETLRVLSSPETRTVVGGDTIELEASHVAWSKCETQCYTCHPECTLSD
jgi:hypothetical protein